MNISFELSSAQKRGKDPASRNLIVKADGREVASSPTTATDLQMLISRLHLYASQFGFQPGKILEDHPDEPFLRQLISQLVEETARYGETVNLGPLLKRVRLSINEALEEKGVPKDELFNSEDMSELIDELRQYGVIRTERRLDGSDDTRFYTVIQLNPLHPEAAPVLEQSRGQRRGRRARFGPLLAGKR